MELAQHVAGLPAVQEHEKEEIKRFDLLVFQLELAVLGGEPGFTRLKNRARKIAAGLESAAAVPEVGEHLELIQDMQSDEFWDDITLPILERMRKALRKLVIHIDKKARGTVLADFKDELGEEREIVLKEFKADEITEYKRRVMSFLEVHGDNFTLYKLKHNHQITAADLNELERLLFESGDLGDRATFEAAFGPQEQLGVFIRSLIGLDRGAAKVAFGQYLDQKNFNADQIRFVNQIIDYLMVNGVMETEKLYEQPFTDAHSSGLDGVFDEKQADEIVKVIDFVKAQAIVAERSKRQADQQEAN